MMILYGWVSEGGVGGWGSGEKPSTFAQNVQLSLFKCQLSDSEIFRFVGGILSRRQARGKFWDIRCDSLLPESIPDCKSDELAQIFPPPAGSFSETSKKMIQFSASGGVIHNMTSTEAPRAALFHNMTSTEAPQAALFDNLTSTEAPRAALFHNMTSTEAPRTAVFHNITSTEAPRTVLFHNMTSNLNQNFSIFFWIRLVI